MVLALFVVPSTRADCTNKTLDDTELDKQEKALNTFYDALNGDFWRINTDWDSTGNDGTGECLSVRYGVGTDSTSALVDEIFLPHNCLSGTIPKAGTAIAALSSLTRLNVVGNSIVSSLPDSFITLKNLVTLEMSSNSISGDLPAGFEFQKTNLLVLDLAYNSFTGSIPMSQWMDPESGMPQLGALFLNHNSFSGSLVTVPLSQTKFTRLEISNNKFTGPVPRYFASSLKYLDMGFNQFTGRLANNGNGLGRCKDLSYIDISNNDITGPLPSADFEILKLKNFEFTYNSLTGTVPDSISKSTDLSALRFSTNCFSGSLPSGIGELVALTKLEAMDTTLGGPIPATIGNLTNLVYVNFQNSQLTGTVPVSLSKLGRNLQYFNAFGNSLTGKSNIESECHSESIDSITLVV
jgi:Leucine-rich repeat (LRR) protein